MAAEGGWGRGMRQCTNRAQQQLCKGRRACFPPRRLPCLPASAGAAVLYSAAGNAREHPLPPCLSPPGPQERPSGAVPEAWLAALAGSGLATMDMAADLAALLGPKDEEEVKNVKKAAYLVANALTKFAVPQLEGGGGVGAARGGGRSTCC